MQTTDVDRSIDGFLSLAKQLRTLSQQWQRLPYNDRMPQGLVTDRKTHQVDDLVADEAAPADVEFTFGWDCGRPSGLEPGLLAQQRKSVERGLAALRLCYSFLRSLQLRQGFKSRQLLGLAW